MITSFRRVRPLMMVIGLAFPTSANAQAGRAFSTSGRRPLARLINTIGTPSRSGDLRTRALLTRLGRPAAA